MSNPQQPQSVELDEILMALMVAGAIEANNSKDGKLTVEIMETSRGFKGSKTALTKLIASVANEARIDELMLYEESEESEDGDFIHYKENRLKQLNQSEGKR